MGPIGEEKSVDPVLINSFGENRIPLLNQLLHSAGVERFRSQIRAKTSTTSTGILARDPETLASLKKIFLCEPCCHPFQGRVHARLHRVALDELHS
jgi:hypothetical protein